MTRDSSVLAPWPLFAMASPRDLAPATEEEIRSLADALARGDPSALGRLYDQCARELWGLALWRTGCWADADDVVPDVFVRLACSTGVLAASRDPRRYLLAMTHHAAADRTRRRRDAPLGDGGELVVASSDERSPTRRLDARRAAAALALLPPTQRETIYLHHFAGLGFREIGKVTAVPTFTAASRYRLGIARLRRALGVAP